MLRIVSAILALLAVFGIAIMIAGYTSQPNFSDHTVLTQPYDREIVWNELINIHGMPSKKSDVVSVEVVEQYGKLLAWREDLKRGGYRIYRMNRMVDNKLLVLELTESSYGLTGIWTFELIDSEGGTDIFISEESKLENTQIRGYRFFFGRNHDLLVWVKYIKVGLTERLLSTP